jgi:hypothetical protein
MRHKNEDENSRKLKLITGLFIVKQSTVIIR